MTEPVITTETLDGMALTVTRHPAYSAATGETATIEFYLPITARRCTIDVYGPAVRFGEITKAEVNWSGIGSCSASDAVAFAAALSYAAGFAKGLAGPTQAAGQ